MQGLNETGFAFLCEPLTSVNYKKWKQDLEIVLQVMDMDLALRTEEPPLLVDGNISS